MMDTSISYYDDMTRISNSNIGWFLKKGPRYLKDMLDGKEEGLKGSFLEKGTMIHKWILEKPEFWKDYLVIDWAAPKSAQQKLFCETYANLVPMDYEPHMDKVEAYRAAYKADKLSDDQCIEKAEELIMCFQDYIDYLTMKDKKIIISYAEHQMLKTIESNLKEHKKANELLFGYPETTEVHNEFHINWEFKVHLLQLGDELLTEDEVNERKKVHCKSLLDRVMIDKTNKKITLVDIKTTVDIYNFAHSVEEYDYCRQLAYYWMAIHWYFKNELKEDISKYSYETYIIGVQSHSGHEVKVFKFTPTAIENQADKITNALKDIKWHQVTNNWEHVKNYYEGDGSEILC